jgi:hypothetical protein
MLYLAVIISEVSIDDSMAFWGLHSGYVFV